MRFVNPSGYEKVILSKEGEVCDIWIEDFSFRDVDFVLDIELRAANTVCRVRGRVNAQNTNSKKWKIHQTFLGRAQVGDISIHGIAEGDSFLDVDGGATLSAKSIQGNVNINERVWAFNDARVNLLPQLNIFTDNVDRATHAASVTPVQEEWMFFLESRGFCEEKAKELLKVGLMK